MAIIMVHVGPGKIRPLAVDEAFALGFAAGAGVPYEKVPKDAVAAAWDALVKKTEDHDADETQQHIQKLTDQLVRPTIRGNRLPKAAKAGQ